MAEGVCQPRGLDNAMFFSWPLFMISCECQDYDAKITVVFKYYVISQIQACINQDNFFFPLFFFFLVDEERWFTAKALILAVQFTADSLQTHFSPLTNCYLCSLCQIKDFATSCWPRRTLFSFTNQQMTFPIQPTVFHLCEGVLYHPLRQRRQSLKCVLFSSRSLVLGTPRPEVRRVSHVKLFFSTGWSCISITITWRLVGCLPSQQERRFLLLCKIPL